MSWRAAVLGAVVLTGAAACTMAGAARRSEIPDGDPSRGASLIRQVGCGSCHEVPGVRGADGLVGPPLVHFARRRIVAGVLTNTPDHVELWLQHPQQVVPGNAMPDLGLSAEEARDIAAYLYTLG
jgi:cytochrome c2